MANFNGYFRVKIYSSIHCVQKPLQYSKVISLQLK